MEEAKEECRIGVSAEKEKAAKADAVMGKIYNVTFVLSLSALVDIYSVYSDLTNFLQVVNIMPFDRMDKFHNRLAAYNTMLGHVDPVDCPCSVFACTSTYEVCEIMGVDGKEEMVKGIIEDVCSWPKLHNDLREFHAKSTYKNVVMGALREDGSKTREGVAVQAANRILNKDSVIKNVFSRATDVVTFLYNGLKERVYKNDDIVVIGNIRRLLDLKSKMKRIEIHGATRISSLEWRQFKESAVFIEQDVLTRVGEDELRTQFREFNRRLEELNENPVARNMENCSILGMFLDPKKDLYRYLKYLNYNKEGREGKYRTFPPSLPCYNFRKCVS